MLAAWILAGALAGAAAPSATQAPPTPVFRSYGVAEGLPSTLVYSVTQDHTGYIWIGTHAGLADTSLLLAVAPGMVRLAQLRNAPKPGAADGVYGGDPRRASAELGQLGVDALVKISVDSIKKAVAAPR